jgi:hypothetical protein
MLDFQYVPVLKGRNGEYGALAAFSSDAKARLLPIIEIPPVPWDHARKSPTKTLGKQVQKVHLSIGKAWGTAQPVLIDMMWVEGAERMDDRSHPATYLFAATRKIGIPAIPVTGLMRDQEYQRAYREIIQQDGQGVCVRLQREDFQDDLPSQLATLVSALGTREREVDLVLDMRAIGSEIEIEDLVSMIDAIPSISKWRSFALCGTGFPTNLMGLPPLASSCIPRLEWKLWRDLVSTRSLTRIPLFGDYVIANPEPSEVDPRVMRASASIRYTTTESWLILKGRNLRDYGFKQFHDVSQALLNSPEYSGRDFSWGDAYINDCAMRRASTGSLTTWRKVGTSHHIAFVLKQLSNFHAI